MPHRKVRGDQVFTPSASRDTQCCIQYPRTGYFENCRIAAYVENTGVRGTVLLEKCLT
jgi:hypothetical protein